MQKKFQITITCSEASSMVNSLDKVKVVINGSSNGSSSLSNYKKYQISDGNGNNATTRTALLARPEKTSFNCEGKPGRPCERSGRSKVDRSRSNRSRSKEKVALQSRKLKVDSKSKRHIKKSNASFKSVDISNSDYLPVRYGPYGYQDHDLSEGRSWVTVPLFIIFSIIQFKLVAAIFLAFFGPMIVFLLIVQGFLFKATLVMLGLMMS